MMHDVRIGAWGFSRGCEPKPNSLDWALELADIPLLLSQEFLAVPLKNNLCALQLRWARGETRYARTAPPGVLV